MTENYSLEIDFLPVGEESKSGDAIAMRFGEYKNGNWLNPYIIIIDGGNSDSGDSLVRHVKEVYNSNTVDRVILTHPDGDHASGLRNVIENLKVGKIWMHRPWKYWPDLKDSIVDNRVTKKSFTEGLKESYQFAYDIEQLANKKKIEIFQPKQGASFCDHGEDLLTVLGPSKDLYLRKVKESEKTPDMGISESKTKTIPSKKTKLVNEDMSFATEHLANDDEVTTTAENDMSLVILLTVGGVKALFSGDAGTQGLFTAIKYSGGQNIILKDLTIFDVPHHGSRHNLSKGILKYINAEFAIISCAVKGEPNHPSKIVTNSLLRRNINPYKTQGIPLLFSHKVPNRYTNPAVPIPFYNRFEITIDE